MDRSLRIVWYDLPQGKDKQYLKWLHSHYLPLIQSQSGIMWAANYKIIKTNETIKRLGKFVGRPDKGTKLPPTGSDYAMIIGASSPDSFPHDFEKTGIHNRQTTNMLNDRIGTRIAITVEQSRVNGPEVDHRAEGATPGPFIQLGHFLVRSTEEEFDLNSWYAQYRLPTIAKMPGAIAARKMVSVAGWAKHIILYEFVSEEAHHTNFMSHEILAFDDGEWTNRVVKYTAHAPGSPSIGQRLCPR